MDGNILADFIIAMYAPAFDELGEFDWEQTDDAGRTWQAVLTTDPHSREQTAVTVWRQTGAGGRWGASRDCRVHRYVYERPMLCDASTLYELLPLVGRYLEYGTLVLPDLG